MFWLEGPQSLPHNDESYLTLPLWHCLWKPGSGSGKRLQRLVSVHKSTLLDRNTSFCISSILQN